MSDFFKRFQFLRARKLGVCDSFRTALEVTILVWKAERKVRRKQENNILRQETQIKMNIDDLTVGQIKQINELLRLCNEARSNGIDGGMIGKKVIIRTYSAGVWFGTLAEKDRKEVILSDARRMWKWWAKEGISLSAVAVHGIKQDMSKITAPVSKVWLEAIEIIPCTDIAIKSIEGSEHAQAE